MKDNYKEKLTALLKGLKCQEVETLVDSGSPELLRRLGEEIGKAASLGSNLYKHSKRAGL